MNVEGDFHREIGDIDHETAALILQIQRNDIEELLDARNGKGKTRDDQICNHDHALEVYREELCTRQNIAADRCIGRSIARAVISDAAILAKSHAEEDRAVQDRAIAHQLAGVDSPLLPETRLKSDSLLGDSALLRLEALYVPNQLNTGNQEDLIDDGGSEVAESSTLAASRQQLVTKTASHCTVCDARKSRLDVLEAPCGHTYCSEDLQTWFRLSVTDENLIPPRCCRQAIPLDLARLYLGSDLIHTFKEKSVEFKTINPTYCCRASCSTFIAPDDIVGERAKCGSCGTETCTFCKTSAHSGDCPENTALHQVLATARDEHWQRCNNCGRIIELDVGCNHMRYVVPSRWSNNIYWNI